MRVRRVNTPIAALAAGIVFAAGLAAGGAAMAAKVKQPAMEAALTHLQKAKRKLENATNDEGGHRKKAIDLTSQAIAEVQKAVLLDKQ